MGRAGAHTGRAGLPAAACVQAFALLALSCWSEVEEPETRPTLPLPPRSGGQAEPEDAIDYYPRFSELDIGYAKVQRRIAPMAPQCVRDAPHEGPAAVLMEHEWDTPMLGWAANRGSLASFPKALLSVTEGRLWKLDRQTGEVLYVTRDYNWTGGQADMNKGLDGLAYLSCPDLLAIDPVDLRPLHADWSTGFGSHCKDPLILPDGRVAMHSVFGDLRMYRPVPPEEGETTGGYVLDWRLAHGGDGWLARLLYDAERDLIITGSGLIREDGTRRWETFAIRAADGTRVWTVPRTLSPQLLVGDESFIGRGGTQTDEGQNIRMVERRNRLTADLEASFAWEAPQGTDPWEMGHHLAASPDGRRIYVSRLFGTRRDEGGKLRFSKIMALDQDLNHLWSFSTEEPAWSETPALDRSGFVNADIHTRMTVMPDRSLVASTRSCEIYRFSPDGEMLWSDLLPYPMSVVPPLVDGDRLRVLMEHDPRRLGGQTTFSVLRSYRFEPSFDLPVMPDEDVLRERGQDPGPFDPTTPGVRDPVRDP